MKIEKRGKYPGVKVHLEPDEAKVYIQFAKDITTSGQKLKGDITYVSLSAKLGTKISKLIEEDPTLLEARTEEEIKHELEVELESAQLKLKALNKGKDWKEIHVK